MKSTHTQKPFLIVCQMHSKGAWHVYKRFSNPDERDRVLAAIKRRANINWMELKAEDEAIEITGTPAYKTQYLGTAELNGVAVMVYLDPEAAGGIALTPLEATADAVHKGLLCIDVDKQ